MSDNSISDQELCIMLVGKPLYREDRMVGRIISAEPSGRSIHYKYREIGSNRIRHDDFCGNRRFLDNNTKYMCCVDTAYLITGKTCFLCSSQCKKDNTCEFYDGPEEGIN